MDNIRQERLSKGPNLNLNKRLEMTIKFTTIKTINFTKQEIWHTH